MILSASRRTDMPAFYCEWFMNRIREGYVLTKNPMNAKQISRIELSPTNIDCIVFWSKDPEPMLDKLYLLDRLGFSYYFQFTLNPYDRELEGKLREKAAILKTFHQLSQMIGKERVMWRYDPIIMNDWLTPEYHLESFHRLCNELKGYTQICTISFVDLYRKLKSQGRMEFLKEISEEQMHRTASIFASIAADCGIELRACCEKVDLSTDGVKPAACIDKKAIEQICGHEINAHQDKNQREGCGCIRSVDIGAYNTCRNGCIYCYANHSEKAIDSNIRKHDPQAPLLIG